MSRSGSAGAAPGLRFGVELAAGRSLLVAEPTDLARGIRLQELELELPSLGGRIDLSPGSAALRSARTALVRLGIHIERERIGRWLGAPTAAGGASLEGDLLRIWSWLRQDPLAGGVESCWRMVGEPPAPPGCVMLVPTSVVAAGPLRSSAWAAAQADLDRVLRPLAGAAPTSAFAPRREGALRIVPAALLAVGCRLLAVGRRLPGIPEDVVTEWETDGPVALLRVRRGDPAGRRSTHPGALGERIAVLRELAAADDAIARGATDEALDAIESAATPGAHPLVVERLVDLLMASADPILRRRGAELVRALPDDARGGWSDGALTRCGTAVEAPLDPGAVPVVVALAAMASPGTRSRLERARAALALRPADPALQALCAAAAAESDAGITAPVAPHAGAASPPAPGDDHTALAQRRTSLSRAADEARNGVERAAALQELGVFLYQDAGEDAAGLEALRSAFALAPEQATSQALSAAEAAARALGDRQSLLEIYALRAVREPDQAALWRLLRCDTLAAGDQLAEAIALVSDLLDGAEDPGALLVRRAAWRRVTGDEVGAAADLRRLIAGTEHDSFERIEHLRALAALGSIGRDERVQALAEVVAAVPGDDAVLRDLVHALLEHGDAAQAVAHAARRLGQLLGRTEALDPTQWAAVELDRLDPELTERAAALLADALAALDEAGAGDEAERVMSWLCQHAEHAPGAVETAVEWARTTARFGLAATGAERLARLVFDAAEQAQWRDRAAVWRRRAEPPRRATPSPADPRAIDAALDAIDAALGDAAPDAALELVANWLPRVNAPAARYALLLRRARALLTLQRPSEAQMPLRGAAILDPDAVDLRIEQAMLAHQLGQHERVRELRQHVATALSAGSTLDAASSERLARLDQLAAAADQNGTESS